LRQSSALVAIAHPGERGAYTPEDFAHLSGYDLLEIVNGPDRYTALWDAALSSGHPVWGLADDDSHDVTDADHTMVAWTMIDAPTTRAGDIIAALRDGRSYAVSGTAAATEATVDRVTLVGTRLIVECSGAPTDYTFIGQDGRVLRTAGGGPSAAYDIAATDPYVRAEIGTAHGRIYLNPVVRYDGAGPASPRAVVDPARSWFHRAVWGGGCLLLVGAILTGRGAFTA